MAGLQASQKEKGDRLLSEEEKDLGSEYECELMIEALRKELDMVREQLAFLTHQLDTEEKQQSPPLPRSPTRSSPKSESLPVQSPRQPSPSVASKAERPKVKRKETAAAQWAKQKHYLSVVDEVEEKRSGLRRECLCLMQRHMEQQLQRLQETSRRLHRRLRQRQDRERATRLQLKPVRFRSSGVDDKSFLENLYQGTFYQIVGLEHRLRKSGKLSSLADLKDFWNAMLFSPTPSATPMKESAPPLPPTVWEEEEEDYSTSWAITALPPEHYRKSQTPTTAIPSKSTSPASLKFQPMKLPELKSVADILNEGRPLSNEQREVTAHVVRMQELTGGRKRTQQMYQQARANEMAMRRLLPDLQAPSFDPSPLLIKAPPIAGQPPRHRPELQLSAQDSTDASQPPRHRPELHPSVPPQNSTDAQHPCEQNQESLRHSPTPHASPTEPSPMQPPSSPSSSSSPTKPMLVPLTMTSVLQRAGVKEFKGKSALWSNYLLAGR